MRYIAMLRGINLGSHNRISMPELKIMCEKLNMTHVVTYLQSGNIAFDSTSRHLKERIESAIQKEFTHTVAVIIKTADELNKIVISNPFMTRGTIDQAKLHATFLDAIPALVDLPTQTGNVDEWRMNGDVIYLHCPNGYGHTKLTNGFFELKLKVNATTRNWKTVLALQNLTNN